MIYDIAVIGSGPAGLTAAIYAQRYNMKAVVFGNKPGGLMTENPFIENYPGFKLVDGAKLGEEMVDHAKGLGAEMVAENVKEVKKKDGLFTLKTEWDTSYQAKTLLLAHGLKSRKLGAKNEEKFWGKGISGCATCDAAFFKDKVTGVVGGGDSAGVAALIVREFAKKVYLIYRRDKFFRMQPPYVDKIMKDKKIEVIFQENVKEFYGKEKLEGVKLEGGRELPLDGFFIEIGFEPEIPYTLSFKLELDDKGFIKVKRDQSTSELGVFAAGDITTESNMFHQIATAISEGAIAADSAYIHTLKHSGK